jgi:hypothetical protein
MLDAQQDWYWGPRYILRPNGEVAFTGSFSEFKQNYTTTQKIIDRLKAQFEKSYILKATLYKEIPFNSDDVKVFVAIVDRARTIFEARYPGSEFYVLFWDRFYDDNLTEDREELLRSLGDKGIRVRLVSNIIQDNSIAKYSIAKRDWHPNAFANKLVAEYVINNILKE